MDVAPFLKEEFPPFTPATEFDVLAAPEPPTVTVYEIPLVNVLEAE
jgi:hypothetical protein